MGFFINEWRKVHKSPAVILPTVATILIAGASILQNAIEANFVPDHYKPLVLFVIPTFAYIGQIIHQGGVTSK